MGIRFVFGRAGSGKSYYCLNQIKKKLTNDKNNKFYIQIGEHQKNNVYLNDEMLLAPMELKENDVIEMGDTKLMFRPFCNDSFRWEK